MSSDSQTIVGLDIGSKNIRAVIAQPPNADRDFPRIINIAKTNSEGLRHGYVVNAHDVTEGVTKTLRQLEKTSNISISRAYITIGSVSLASSRVTSDVDIVNPDMTVRESHLSACISRIEKIFYDATRNKKILHIFPNFWELDTVKTMGSPVGMQGHILSCSATVVHCQEHHYNDLLQSVSETGVQVLDVIATPIAESYPVLSKQDRIAGCALVNIGSETLSISVYENDTLVSLAVFPIGSTHITHDIALGFQIPIPDAETIKHGDYDGPISKKKLSDIIEARAEDMFELIKNHLKTIDRDVLLPGGIIITGGGGLLSGIAHMAKQSLELPVKTPTLENIFKTNKRDIDQSWIPAFGVCYLENTAEVLPSQKINAKNIAKEAKGTLRKFLEQFIP
jgi:cell division protein FtsA